MRKNRDFFSAISRIFKRPSVPKVASPLEILIAALSTEVEKYKLKKLGFSPDYAELVGRVDFSDIIAIYEWLIKNKSLLGNINSGKPVRFEAYDSKRPGSPSPKELKPTDYPFPITVYINSDKGVVYVNFDPNSKLARTPGDPTIKKDSPPKPRKKPKKFIASGSSKVVRTAWAFNTATRQIEPSVALVCKGQENIDLLKKELEVDQPDNPFLWRIRGFMEYSGHNPDEKGPQPKAIAFAARAQSELYNFIDDMQYDEPKYTVDLGDILWMTYAAISGLAQLNAKGRLHRDVKPENFLFIYNEHGVCLYLTDFGLSMDVSERQEAKGTPKYIAFDHSVYGSAIECHATILREIRTLEECYLQGAQPSQALAAYFVSYIKLRKERSAQQAGLDYLKTMKHRFSELSAEFGNCRNPEDHKKAMEIILKQNRPIKISPDNHPTGETWAVCRTLEDLINYFRAYGPFPSKEQPPILLTLSNLFTRNLEAGYESRMTTPELQATVENLLGQMLAQSSMDNLTEEQFVACRQKLLAQFSFHKVTLLPEVALDRRIVASSQIVVPPMMDHKEPAKKLDKDRVKAKSPRIFGARADHVHVCGGEPVRPYTH